LSLLQVSQAWKLGTPVTVIERNEYGQKHYSYSSQESAADGHPSASNQNKSGSLLSGVHRPRRTAIKL
ncbi:recombinase family protein, partial [Streptococcus agalactiae]